MQRPHRHFARENLFQRRRIQPQLRRIDFDFGRQIARGHGVGLEIHQPDFVRPQHRQIRHALHHDEFIFQFPRRRPPGDLRQLLRTEPRREGHLPPHLRGLGPDVAAQCRIPEHGQRVQIQDRQLGRR